MNKKITPGQVEAAKLRIILDRKLSRETPDWVTELSKQTPSRRSEMTLQDDIARYGKDWNTPGICAELSDAIATGLERDYRLVKRDQEQEGKPKYKNGGYTGDGHETVGRKSDHLTRAFLKTKSNTYVASTISPRLSRQDILAALTDHGSTFPKADELLEERDDRIRKNAAWRALADAADSMPEMNGAAYMYYVRTWLHNRAKDTFRGD